MSSSGPLNSSRCYLLNELHKTFFATSPTSSEGTALGILAFVLLSGRLLQLKPQCKDLSTMSTRCLQVIDSY